MMLQICDVIETTLLKKHKYITHRPVERLRTPLDTTTSENMILEGVAILQKSCS